MCLLVSSDQVKVRAISVHHRNVEYYPLKEKKLMQMSVFPLLYLILTLFKYIVIQQTV